MSCNLSLAIIWKMTYTHKLPKLCAATLRETVSLTCMRLVINLSTDLKFTHTVIAGSTFFIDCYVILERQSDFILYNYRTVISRGIECKSCSCDRSNKIFTEVLYFYFNNGHSWKHKATIYRYFLKPEFCNTYRYYCSLRAVKFCCNMTTDLSHKAA